MHYDLYDSPIIEPSTSSYGRWMIRLSVVTIRYFWRRPSAETFLAAYLAGSPTMREHMAHRKES